MYDDIDNFKESLKKAIVARLRKQTKGVQQNYDAQIQNEIYGPLYNEIDRLASRTYKFDILTNGNYLDILETYKYLFDKTDPTFQKTVNSFYKTVDEFNTCLAVAEQATKKIVRTECLAFFKVEQMTRVRVEILNELNETRTIEFQELLLRRISAENYSKIVYHANEKIINTTYRFERSQRSDVILLIRRNKAQILLRLARQQLKKI